MIQSKVKKIAKIIGVDVGRGIQRLTEHTNHHLFNAASSLANHPSPRVGICTGFFIPPSNAAETDGPIGAALLAAGLIRNHIPVQVLTDRFCMKAVQAAVKSASPKTEIEVIDPETENKEKTRFTHFITIERAGPSTSGSVCNMSGVDITNLTPNLREFYKSEVEIAIGDGGNEIGMGSIPKDLIAEDIRYGDIIACVVPCDHLIVSGVSNWGAWGLLAALQLLKTNWDLTFSLDGDIAKRVLEDCVRGGAVDGVTGRSECTVDGLEWKAHLKILNQILDTFLRKRETVIVRGERRSANRTKWNSNTDRRTNIPNESIEDSVFDYQTTRFHRDLSSFQEDVCPKQSDRVESCKNDSIWDVAEDLHPLFYGIDRLVDRNGRRVRAACRDQGLGPHHFAGSTGYGHGDLGRQAMDAILAQSFGAEAALVRHQFMSGTHAIAAALFGVLRPGEDMICISGSPYDTLHEVIGINAAKTNVGSLKDWNVSYRQIDLLPNGTIDLSRLETMLYQIESRVVYLQRSCGYASRPTLKMSEIEKTINWIKRFFPECLVLVDNCYGEFTETIEPTHVGADLIMGSLIKNPGGTIVPTGGYVAGKKSLIEGVNARLCAPGMGIDAGSISGDLIRQMVQGFCLAPQMVGEALKSAALISRVMNNAGFRVFPPPGSKPPCSVITSIELGSEERMIRFCKAVQKICPVGSYVTPVPGVTAGYEDPVIFADGTFIDGSTSEVSADGPIRSPFLVYCQGGTHWTQWTEVLESVLTEYTS